MSRRRRAVSAVSLAQIQPPPSPAGGGNTRSLKHGAYSSRVKAPRVAEVLDELVRDHPHEAVANLRALAELYVTAERLSDWVTDQVGGGISASGKLAPALLEARRSWSLYLERARELGVTFRGRRELAVVAAETSPPGELLARHLRGS